ncbi:TonB-dependent receptor [Gilvimarinus sp. SDUM040013]|uniref:TonB-dependent receptor n=1 Tax=Gilvimarinus gilvus TaxID=3058038 RepID=A0ABU4RY42_9GAMM|nr:TonB-dependent receptor [Gilvimarinus sp. SDUM040013]MDO3386516.1 TonB-dependent receptor [Gilvimarinus sp. SDUM040013]MDX6849092.1 TonB-dependent receptor [Gilvimarinus sp. SDUM040013]
MMLTRWGQARALGLLALILCPGVLGAEVAQEPDIETVVVTTAFHSGRWKEAVGAVSVLDAERQMPGLRQDSAELLAGFAGVQADSRSNFAQDTRISLRGFGARSAFGVRGINLRVDGVPLTMPDGQSQTSSLLLDSVASVEVLRGPVASLYGNAAGGTIAFNSVAPEFTATSFGIAAGSARQRRYQLQSDWAGAQHSARVIARQFSTEGFREHSSAKRQQLAAQWYFQGDSGLDVRARFDASRDPLTEDPQGITYEQWIEDPQQVHPVAKIFDPRKSIEHQQMSLSASKAQTWGQWQASGWLGTRDVAQFLSFPGDDLNSGGAVIDLDRQFAGVTASAQRSVGSLDWLLGGEFGFMRDDRKGFVNNRGGRGELKRDEVDEVANSDVFTGLTWRIAPPWTVRTGARFSRVSFDVMDNFVTEVNPDDSSQLSFSEPSYFAGVNYEVGQSSLFGNIGSGFETPTLTELAYRNEGTGFNDALVPARNRQLELGWRLASDNWQNSVVMFVIRTLDELVVDQSEGGRTTYRNGAETERQGIEWMLDGAISAQLDWRLSATWLEAEYSKGPYAGNQIPGVARENLYSQWDWKPWGDDVKVSISGYYRSGVMTSDDNSERVPSALTWDVAVSSGWQLGRWGVELWAKCANLTDKSVVGSVIVNQSRGRTIEPAPGRQFNLGVAVTQQW